MSSELFVEKIGGGSSGTAEAMERNVMRFAQEADLRAVAVSGQGGEAGRATDDVISYLNASEAQLPTGELEERLEFQFDRIARPLGAFALATQSMDEVRSGVEDGRGKEWTMARPEFFIARTYAYLLDQAGIEHTVVNPYTSIFTDVKGRIDRQRTQDSLGEALTPDMVHIIPGYAAMSRAGYATTLGRGGTDITGMLAADALEQFYGDEKQIVYRLSKDDIAAITRVSPKIMNNPAQLKELSIAEMETMALGGSEVVAAGVLDIHRDTGVRVVVRNTFNHDNGGTTIVSERSPEEGEAIVGIANQRVVEYKLRGSALERTPGVIRGYTDIFNQFELPIVDMQTSAGVVTAYVADKLAKGAHTKLMEAFEHSDELPGTVEVRSDLELVALVGEAIRNSHVAGEVVQALYAETKATSEEDDNIPIRSIWQNEEEPSIYLTVPRVHAEAYIKRLYERFFSQAA